MTAAKAEILVIDDVPSNVLLLSIMLKKLGYRVREAHNAMEGLAQIKQQTPHLVLLDVDMPKMNGYQLCRHIKADGFKHLPVIFISALDESHDKVKGFESGGVDYITKPFNFKEVQVRVETHLAIHQLQAELREKNQLLEAELARAGNIQKKLLPKTIPTLSGFEIAATCEPLKEVGGDFYDWQTIDGDRLNITLGDVMGKGMPAALLMTTVRATLRALGKQTSPITQLEDAQILLEADLSPSESFVTLFHGQLDAQSRRLDYIDVGHGLVLLKRANGQIERVNRGGIPMGIVANQTLKGSSIEFQSGDMLLLFTDGLMEIFPDAGASPEKFLTMIDGVSGAQATLDRIFAAIRQQPNPPDDVTVMVLACQ